jgi:hypothetical protein
MELEQGSQWLKFDYLCTWIILSFKTAQGAHLALSAFHYISPTTLRFGAQEFTKSK